MTVYSTHELQTTKLDAACTQFIHTLTDKIKASNITQFIHTLRPSTNCHFFYFVYMQERLVNLSRPVRYVQPCSQASPFLGLWFAFSIIHGNRRVEKIGEGLGTKLRCVNAKRHGNPRHPFIQMMTTVLQSPAVNHLAATLEVDQNTNFTIVPCQRLIHDFCNGVANRVTKQTFPTNYSYCVINYHGKHVYSKQVNFLDLHVVIRRQ